MGQLQLIQHGAGQTVVPYSASARTAVTLTPLAVCPSSVNANRFS
jgi:hypothetical protein